MDRMLTYCAAVSTISGVASAIWGVAKQYVGSETETQAQNGSNNVSRFEDGARSFPRIDLQPFFMEILGDEGASSSKGDQKRKKMRNLANRLLQLLGENLDGALPGVIMSSETMVESWVEYEGKNIEVVGKFKLLTSQVISQAAFGCNCGETKTIFADIGQIMESKDDEIQSEKLEKSVTDGILRIVKEREQTKIWNNDFGSGFVGKLLEANQEISDDNTHRISIQDIVDECKTFCFLGYESTTSLLRWMVFRLAKDKELQDRTRKEVIEMFGGETPYPDGIARMKTMNMILEDTLRLYLLAPLITRKVEKEVQLHEQKRIVQGTVDKTTLGYGPGTCLGLNFAMTVAKVVLSIILQRFTFTQVHSPQVFAVHPRNGLEVILQKMEEEEPAQGISARVDKAIYALGVVASVASVAENLATLFGGSNPKPHTNPRNEVMNSGRKPRDTGRLPGHRKGDGVPSRLTSSSGKAPRDHRNLPKDGFNKNTARHFIKKAAPAKTVLSAKGQVRVLI